MNRSNKILLSISLIVSSSNYCMTKDNIIQDQCIEMQFTPNYDAPFSDEADDQHMAEFLRLFINLDKEVFHDPNLIIMMKNKNSAVSTMQDLATGKTKNFALSSKDKSFGWNDPIAIAYSIFSGGQAYTPNTITIAAGESENFPGNLEFKFEGKGLYQNSDDIKKEAHAKFVEYLKRIPSKISKYADLQEITTIEELCANGKSGKFDSKKKDEFINNLPTLQGEIKTKCTMGTCDVFGTIICHPVVLAYLQQEMNGNRHKNNTVPQNLLKNNQNVITSQLSPTVVVPELVDSDSTINKQDKLIDLKNELCQIITESNTLTDEQQKNITNHIKNSTEQELEEFINTLKDLNNKNDDSNDSEESDSDDDSAQTNDDTDTLEDSDNNDHGDDSDDNSAE